MDKGAHFYRCDFQAHSPRDVKWSGDRPLTADERKDYARDFIKKCREIALHAVAITDHHDFGFYPYIKEAANSELDDNGQPISDQEKIIVFPGLELTLSTPPCQAILIIDADYQINNLNQILHLLGITPNSADEATTIETLPITNTIVNGFEELYDKLNSIETLRGKFIVLPNLSEKGRHTLLRAGNSEHYKKMPCVGGYVDGSITQHGNGNKNIISGIAKEWGYKSVAAFQTSDNRQRDFSALGTHSTWVKWATPTAEALRQACLAKESRLSQNLPELPQIFITKIDVTNSKFLSSFSIEFNQQYTALIGGRGTGKSSILEYLRWGLCDQTVLSNIDEQSDLDRRRQSLINKTLIPFNGEVQITFSVNGIIHLVKRNSVNKKIYLKIGNNEFEQVNEDEVRRILPIQAYSQKQLSSVGVRTEELKRFIQLPIANQLNNLKFQLNDIGKKIRTSYTNYLRKKGLQNEIDEFNLEIKSLNNQVENLRSQLKGISERDQVVIANKKKYDFEQSLINKAKREISSTEIKLRELNDFLKLLPDNSPHSHSLQNTKLITEINAARVRKFDKIKSLAKQLIDSLSQSNLPELTMLFEKWEILKVNYEIQYEASKAKTTSNQVQLAEIQRLENRLSELNKNLEERTQAINELGDPENDLNQFRDEWFSLHSQKITILNDQSQNFSQLSKGLIKAEITKSIEVKQIKTELTQAFQGTRISENKIQSLCDIITSSENPLEQWKELVNELKALAEIKLSEEKKIEIPETPVLSSCDYNDGNRTRIVEILTPEAWLNLATKEIEFSPQFQYITNSHMGDVIPFSEASAGQQATALLTVLLNQPGTPLVIDQPEDDIDNRAIKDIIKNIWEAKKKRQLIFTSHNANLVVNGDAELVVFCDYRESRSQTRGIIKAEGAIDYKIVRDEITSVMEGGEKAFRLRKDKYGF
ncbi:hypothetical protein GCM10007415_31520 [Parapedobacter pyrenivorans]|uniref:Uncharacterized protein n=1 Tax=Parapedobacter pyrenivorans TaxID=1305674 RepID=A0A917MC68_9SPHI|nr:AAA family ATPase [Parapedobacter pyrenivorans]GGG94154.1 hypothetical protein GCM10007415_31520 [Parapedobacter pyrenivorans]